MLNLNFRPIAYLRRMYRGSPWVIMAVAIHLIVGAIAGVAVMRSNERAPDDSGTTLQVTARPRPTEDPVEPPERIDRKAIPKDEQAELVTFEEDVYIPTTETTEDFHLDRGDPNALDALPDGSTGGTAIGVGTGGHAGGGTPSAFSGRRLGTGPGKGRGGGATAGTERAVLEGLRWLARHQNDDGSWGATTFATHCTTEPPCMPRESELGTKFDCGMTALALLAFLGQGISVDSKLMLVDTAMGTPPRSAGEIVRNGIKWLIAQQRPDGSFSTMRCFEFPENDTLPTMALCEAYGLSHNRALKRPAQRALDFLIAAQKRGADGVLSGWGVGSQADLQARFDKGELEAEELEELRQVVDPTVTCWVVMALQSAQLCGLEVPSDVLPSALAFVIAANAKDSAAVHVAGAGDPFVHHKARHKALSMLTRTFGGTPITDPYLESAALELSQDIPEVGKDGLSIDFYYWYFGTIALNQYDGPDSPRGNTGKYWNRWNKGLVDALMPLQNDSSKRNVCSRGGWLQLSRGNKQGLQLRNTALNIMTLEVYYRFDNVFGAATRQKP